jgi:hypothetical protein
MGSNYEALIIHLRGKGFNFKQNDEKEVLSFGMEGDSVRWNVMLCAKQKRDDLIAYSILPINVPPERRPTDCEFIMRVNYNLPLGNFEMDMNDGEVRYKTSLALGGQELTDALIHPVLTANLQTMSRYLPGLMKVIFSNDDVAEAVKSCEME